MNHHVTSSNIIFSNIVFWEAWTESLTTNLFTERYRKLQEDFQEAASTVQEQKLLITQLEEDLRSFNAVSSMFRGEAEGEPVTGSLVEADVVAEVVKDVIPGFNDFLLDWKTMSQFI